MSEASRSEAVRQARQAIAAARANAPRPKHEVSERTYRPVAYDDVAAELTSIRLMLARVEAMLASIEARLAAQAGTGDGTGDVPAQGEEHDHHGTAGA